MRHAFILSIVGAVAYGCLYILFIAASIFCYLRSTKKKNLLLKPKEIIPTVVVCVTVCVLEIVALISQQMVFTADHRFTPTAKGWGFIRSFSSHYLIPLVILSFAYLILLQFMDTGYKLVDESESKHRVPGFIANRSITSKAMSMLGVLGFGVISCTVSFIPAVCVTLAYYTKPSNNHLYRAYLGMWNYWEVVLLVNALFVGVVAGTSLTIGLLPKDKKPETFARLLNLSLFIVVYQTYSWMRFITVVLDVSWKYPINRVNIRRMGPVAMFCAFLTCSVVFLVGTLSCTSSFLSNQLVAISQKMVQAPEASTAEPEIKPSDQELEKRLDISNVSSA